MHCLRELEHIVVLRLSLQRGLSSLKAFNGLILNCILNTILVFLSNLLLLCNEAMSLLTSSIFPRSLSKDCQIVRNFYDAVLSTHFCTT
ncbi:hypothetical protein DICVIV_14331 [Dictyocaulus viviparus]|uniref:Uncharacterized protein n=1 Tax=Dictyocaulus viviparus TaxID=29172 RepID=A0A0D8XBE2_DICVI|nr:hypothetical protein DICVIV_14331 [Dictyocaulus viviparus]